MDTTVGTISSLIPDTTPCTDAPVLPSVITEGSSVVETPIFVTVVKTTTQNSSLPTSTSKAVVVSTLQQPHASVQISTLPCSSSSTTHAQSVVPISTATAPNDTFTFHTNITANATAGSTFVNGAKEICGSGPGPLLATVLLVLGIVGL
ncbi:hypothetical protein P171DRAFT_485002 [Karstenula rhodostoma CBS 690.94]|uniref:Uncharacterized protein n=1 Tax=Karstenula rhodostoma CBS 690.94 TaxID=1392251 RepID=A0A9P4UC71_9PLEO|nr:hypothetical protein P171DRAFT_485002 [Karstenula rhodostoma CBS 690.94]